MLTSAAIPTKPSQGSASQAPSSVAAEIEKRSSRRLSNQKGSIVQRSRINIEQINKPNDVPNPKGEDSRSPSPRSYFQPQPNAVIRNQVTKQIQKPRNAPVQNPQ